MYGLPRLCSGVTDFKLNGEDYENKGDEIRGFNN